MLSGTSFLYTLVLFSELSGHLVAVPATTAEDSARERDDLGLIAGDEPMAELDEFLPLYRRNHLLDDRNDEGRSTNMIVPDMRLKGLRGLNSAFFRRLHLLSDRSLSHVPFEQTVKMERRNTDLDMLRCMVGRVYRPCWETQD